jgi:hypothetical protein
MKYEIACFDKNTDLKLWTEPCAGIADALQMIADRHHAKSKKPLFCGLATITIEGEIEQILVTPSDLGLLCEIQGNETYLIKRQSI